VEQSPLEGMAFPARLTSTCFFRKLLEILGERAWTVWWDLTWEKDVLEPGGRCADANHRRAGEGRDDHDGTSHGAMARQARGELRCHGTSRIVAATLSCRRALAVGAEIRG
jgi:hypothetical protein